MPKCQIVTAIYYSEMILEILKETLKKMCPRLAQKNVFLLHDYAPSHTASSTVVINSFKRQLLSHPLYRLDLVPCDFYLFPELKKGSLETNMRPGRLWLQLKIGPSAEGQLHGWQGNTKVPTKIAKLHRCRWEYFKKRMKRIFQKYLKRFWERAKQKVWIFLTALVTFVWKFKSHFFFVRESLVTFVLSLFLPHLILLAECCALWLWQFLGISIQVSNVVFHALIFARSLGKCWKPRPPASVFNTSLRTWRMIMHWKTMFHHYYCINTENICYISHYFLHYFVTPFSPMSRECNIHGLCSF